MTDTENADHIAMVNAGLEFTIPVAHKMGVRAVEVRPGHAVTEVPIEGNGNHFGVMYAGVLFTVAEILGGALGMASFDSSEYYPLVKEAKISYLKPAKTDVRAAASLDEATIAAVAKEAAENGKADYVFEAEVTDANGVVVATTRNVCQLRKIGS
jgi:thioesterase domain-containing protein